MMDEIGWEMMKKCCIYLFHHSIFVPVPNKNLSIVRSNISSTVHHLAELFDEKNKCSVTTTHTSE